ncbi:MAG: hypothetical protein CMP10_03925 [Zetaproteobacteria bacterium]|nr:hypothetical protein [Pseudobdellovibrionaceae bacterium]
MVALVKVLLVEDDFDFRDTLKIILNQPPIELTTACDGFQAMEYLKSENYHVMITDINLGNMMDGIELIKKMRMSRLNRETKVVVMSGKIDKDLVKTCSTLKVANILAKPFKPESIIDNLTAALKKAG